MRQVKRQEKDSKAAMVARLVSVTFRQFCTGPAARFPDPRRAPTVVIPTPSDGRFTAAFPLQAAHCFICFLSVANEFANGKLLVV
jgi:hypothetical protein